MGEEEAALPKEQEVFFIKNITFIAKSNDRPIRNYNKSKCNRRQLVHASAVHLSRTNLDMGSVPYCHTAVLHLPKGTSFFLP